MLKEFKQKLLERNIRTHITKYRVTKCLYLKLQFDIAEKNLNDMKIIQNLVLEKKHTITLNTKYLVQRCIHVTTL